MMSDRLRVGFGRREITPPFGSPNLYGITCQVGEIWDSLYATALALVQGEDTAIIIGSDLLEILGATHADIRSAVAREIDISSERVLLNTSHTHSAPYLHVEVQHVLDRFGLTAVDYGYVERVKSAMVAAAREAVDRAVPAAALFGRAHVVGVASNRRIRDATGHTIHRIGQAPAEQRALPEGVIDPDVTVVRFDDEDGRSVGAIVNYACHPTAAGGDLHPWVSADFVGNGLRPVEGLLDNAPCLFLQGTAGDVGTGKWVTGKPLDDARSMGNRLATAVSDALGTCRPVERDGLRVLSARVALPLDPLASFPELEREVQRAVEHGDAGTILAAAAKLVLARDAEGAASPAIGVISLGELAICWLPAEVFVATGLEIKGRSPFRHTIVCAYTNNSLEYIPTADAFPEGEFEVDGGFRYTAPGAAELLAEAATTLLRRSRTPGCDSA